MSVFSKGAESMFQTLLYNAGYEDISNTYDSEKLLKIIKEKKPEWLEKVKQRRTEKGMSTNWETMRSRQILDYVCGIDSVIAPITLKDPRRFGFDVTLNPDEIEKKKKKLTRYPIWKEIDITKMAIVYIKIECDSIHLLNSQEVEDRQDKVIDIVYKIDENPEEVQVYTLEI